MADILSDEEIDALLCEEGDKKCKRSSFVYFLLRIRRKIHDFFRQDKDQFDTLKWKLKMLRWKVSGWIKAPFVNMEGRLVHWVLDTIIGRYGGAYRSHPQSHAIMNRVYDHDFLEEFSKAQMIHKLVNLSMRCRREGIVTVLEQLRRHEKMQWFIEQYEINLHLPEKEVTVQEFADAYMEQMQTKLHLFVRELIEFFRSKEYRATKWPYDVALLETLPSRKSYTNLNKRMIEAYTIEELREKVSFYTDIFLHEGILAAEKYGYEEHNPFIKRTLSAIIDGYSMDEVQERASLDIRCHLNQYKEVLEIIDIGFKGVFQGENPRGLEEKLLSFIEEANRKSVSLF